MTAINLGIMGLGRGLVLTLPALRARADVRICGAFDVRADALEQFETDFGAVGHGSLDSLLADPAINAVYVATPHELHASQAIAALRAGKHVLVEKPMATSMTDCLAMTKAAEEAGRILVVGPSHGFDEPVRQAAKLVKSGDYGAVRLVTALNFTDFMYRPRRPEELDSRRGGGVVYSQAAHQIDVVRRIVGQKVMSVRAVAGNWDPARPSEGAYNALMTFAGGAAASLTYSGYGHYDSDELVGWISELGHLKNPRLYGEARRALTGLTAADEAEAKLSRTYTAGAGRAVPPAPHHEHFGFILVSCEKADLKVLPDRIEIYGDEARGCLEIAPPRQARAGVIDEFVSAIIDGIPAIHDGRWGLETMACCAAMLQSSRCGSDVDPTMIITNCTEMLHDKA